MSKERVRIMQSGLRIGGKVLKKGSVYQLAGNIATSFKQSGMAEAPNERSDTNSSKATSKGK